MVGTIIYIPDCGEAVWITVNPQAGHEESSRRHALVISPESYNRKTGLALFCPITSRIKGYPFEVIIPDGFPVAGAILSDQIKNLDWQARNVEYICTLPGDVMTGVLQKLSAIISNK